MDPITLNTDAGTITIDRSDEKTHVEYVARGLPSCYNEPRVMKGDSFYHDAAAGVEALLLALVAEGVTDEEVLENAVDTALQSL